MKVFISHGRNELAKHKLKDFVRDRLHMEPVVLAEQPDLGLTIVEKLEHYGRTCQFALILLTGDDETPSGRLRARQNVIHELGYFHGVLERNRVLLLKEVGVELFSNISGLIYKEFSAGAIESVFEDIRLAVESGNASKYASSIPLSRSIEISFDCQIGSKLHIYEDAKGPINAGVPSNANVYIISEQSSATIANEIMELPDDVQSIEQLKFETTYEYHADSTENAAILEFIIKDKDNNQIWRGTKSFLPEGATKKKVIGHNQLKRHRVTPPQPPYPLLRRKKARLTIYFPVVAGLRRGLLSRRVRAGSATGIKFRDEC